MASREFIKRISHNMLNGSPELSSYVCATLWEFGEVTSSLFFSSRHKLAKSTLNAFGLGGKIAKKEKDNADRKQVYQSLHRLRSQGIVKRKGMNFLLTKKGREILEGIIKRKRLLKNKWDKKYRLVIFDIPEKKRNARNWLRSELYMLEYSQLQMSVFIGRHPLPGDIINDIEHHGIGKYVNYLLVKNVHDKKKMNNFKKS